MENFRSHGKKLLPIDIQDHAVDTENSQENGRQPRQGHSSVFNDRIWGQSRRHTTSKNIATKIIIKTKLKQRRKKFLIYVLCISGGTQEILTTSKH